MAGDEPSRRDVLLSAGGLTALAALGFESTGAASGQGPSVTAETVDRRQIAADAADGNRLWVRHGSDPGTDERFHLLRFPTSAAGTDVNRLGETGWSPEDVQVDLYGAYDRTGLHLTVTVTDEYHRLPATEVAWAFDALRLAFGRPADGEYGPEFLFSYDGKQQAPYVDQLFAGPSGFDSDAVGVSMTIEDGRRRFQLTVPWSVLPDGEPRAGAEIPFGIATRDRDQGGDYVTLSWQDGPRVKTPRISDIGLGSLELLPADPGWTAALLPPSEVDRTAALPKEVDSIPEQVEVEPDDDRPFRLLAVNHGTEPVTLSATVPSVGLADRALTVGPDEALHVAFQPEPADVAGAAIQASVSGPTESGQRTADLSVPVRFVPSDSRLQDRFDELEAGTLEELATLVTRCEEAGIPVAHERVAAAVGRTFLPVGRRDIEAGYHGRADAVATTVETLLEEAVDACRAYLAGDAVARDVPRYETGNIDIDGLGFTATTADGTDERETVFRGFGHFFKARRDMPVFDAFGLNSTYQALRMQDVVDEPPDGSDDLVAVDTDAIAGRTDWLLSRAETHDLAVEWCLDLHDMPQWAETTYDIGVPNPGLMDYNPHDPTAKEILREYVPVAADAVAGHDSVLGVNLTVEAAYGYSGDETSRAGWQAYLEATHGDIETLNDRYGGSYDSFADVPTAGPFLPGGELGPRIYDWAVFNGGRFADWHAEMAAMVRDAGVEAPVYGSPLGAFLRRRNRTLTLGAEPERFGEACDIWSVDEYNYPARYDDSTAAGFCDQFMEYDLLTSLSSMPILDRETHLFTNDEATYYPWLADHVRLASWQAAIHGVSGMVPWTWHSAWRTDRWPAFQDSFAHRPDVTAAYGRTALDLNRLAEEVAAIRERAPRVALLYSLPSQVYAGRRHEGTYYGALDEAYRAVSLSGRRVGFVSEAQVQEGALSSYDLFVVPNATNVASATLDALATYATGDGSVLVLGSDALVADEYDRPHPDDRRRAVMDTARVLPATATAADIRPVVRTMDTKPEPAVELWSPETDNPVQTVEWRQVEVDGRLLVAVANYSHEATTIRVEVDGTTPDRLGEWVTGRQLDGGTVELDSLSPALLEVGGADGLRTEPRRSDDSPNPTLPGQDAPTGNLDSDPLLEDIDGDGRGTVFDAVTYYNNRDSAAVVDNPGLFDFDGDGTPGTIFDAISLYNDIS